jgi:hypothetical protein
MRMLRGRGSGRIAVAAGLALACNEGLKPEPLCGPGFVGICGTVTFVGALPDSTDAVYIVAYQTFPQSPAELFSFQPVPPTQLALDSASRAKPQVYTLPLPNGTYQWVLAAWKKEGSLSTANADSLLREAGFYHDDGDTTSHGSGIVTVNRSGTGLVDFVVDFTNMHKVSYYFPAPPHP